VIDPGAVPLCISIRERRPCSILSGEKLIPGTMFAGERQPASTSATRSLRSIQFHLTHLDQWVVCVRHTLVKSNG